MYFILHCTADGKMISREILYPRVSVITPRNLCKLVCNSRTSSPRQSILDREEIESVVCETMSKKVGGGHRMSTAGHSSEPWHQVNGSGIITGH